MSYDGQNAAFGTADISKSYSATVTGGEVIPAPGIGKRIVIDSITMSRFGTVAALTFNFLSGTNDKTGNLYFIAGSTMFFWGPFLNLQCNPNEAFNLTISTYTITSGGFTIYVQYHIQG